ncbi:CP12 domain-containing protein 2 [Perilla frutescens var. hirtella]|uniref:CP12 domain-containing protein 2 n=1 Tax=Perilla frutescens var. hirtella TaxID=608512 RepID=A0AAD4P2M0_PERFH|nr:CP12 domain-containing protein 2 [Perilla frutescens var. frutescens]KAH6823886.1 CP12 domain-containing protein 2 [Perilla frutescens var. hirtella]
MAAVAGVNVAGVKVFAKASESSPKSIKFSQLNSPWRRSASPLRRMMFVAAAPDKISEKVEESIKKAEEACAGDAVSGECAAAWDEVEELSAAASHARDKQKDSDPLETYCKDNPETDECRTYDN